MAQLLPFASPSLTKLTMFLWLPSMPPAAIRLLMRLSGKEFPALREFALTTSYTQGQDYEMSEAVTSFLAKQRGLEVIDLPYISLEMADTLLAGLANHPTLLFFTAWLPYTNEDGLRQFLDTLVGTCPDIRVLTVVPTEGEREFENLDFQTIRPLLRLKQLKELQVFDRWSIQISDRDVWDMARAWKQMETLNLCANAYELAGTIVVGVQGVPITRLLAFAEAFGSLKRLALCFSFEDDLPKADSFSTRMENLEILGAGSSILPLEKSRAVGEFLGVLFKPGTKLAFMLQGPQSAYTGAFQTESGFTGVTISEPWEDALATIELVHRVQVGGRLMK